MTEDKQVDLVTLAWLGRGDGSLEDWNKLRDEAVRAHNRRTASYLLGMPLLADYLDEALAQVRPFVRRVMLRLHRVAFCAVASARVI